ncbi:MAG: DUF5985 family protein [Deltaproteobacteria bacterium]|nr:DUF5985 family protein [Kofleriaceae bacterium]
MAEAIYVLCALTSTLCALLLGRSYLRTRSSMLLWSVFGFVGLAINNVLLFVDRVVVPETDLAFARTAAALVGVGLLVAGLIWEDR